MCNGKMPQPTGMPRREALIFRSPQPLTWLRQESYVLGFCTHCPVGDVPRHQLRALQLSPALTPRAA